MRSSSVGVVARRGDDEGDRPLAEVLVGAADDADVLDERAAAQDVLDLERVDVAAAADDRVLHAPRDVQEAVLVEAAEVAEVRPAVVGVGRLVLVPILRLHERPAHADLALLARLDRVALGVADQQLGGVVGLADRGPALLGRVVGAGHGELADVHRAVEAADRGAGALLPLAGDALGQRGAGGDRGAEAG